jgi:hypothetical protein
MEYHWIIRKEILERDFLHGILKADWEKAFGWTKKILKVGIKVF